MAPRGAHTSSRAQQSPKIKLNHALQLSQESTAGEVIISAAEKSSWKSIQEFLHNPRPN